MKFYKSLSECYSSSSSVMIARLFSFISQRRAYLEKYGSSLSRSRKAVIFEELSFAYSHLKQLHGIK